MVKTYTRIEAIRRLGIKSIAEFNKLKHNYPEAFVVVKVEVSGYAKTYYDKDTLDRFVRLRAYYKQEKR